MTFMIISSRHIRLIQKKRTMHMKQITFAIATTIGFIQNMSSKKRNKMKKNAPIYVMA